MQLTIGHLMGEVSPKAVKTTPTRRAMLEADLHGRQVPTIGEPLYITRFWLDEVAVRVTDLKFFRYQNMDFSLTYPNDPDQGGWMILYEGPIGKNGEIKSDAVDVDAFGAWDREKRRWPSECPEARSR